MHGNGNGTAADAGTVRPAASATALLLLSITITLCLYFVVIVSHILYFTYHTILSADGRYLRRSTYSLCSAGRKSIPFSSDFLPGNI
jgi:hypothetical protein